MRLTRVLTARAVIQAAILGTVALGALPLAGCSVNLSSNLETETRSVSVEHRSGPIDVATENGAVVVKARPGLSEVTINAEVRARTQERLAQTMVIAERTGEGALRLRVQWPEGKREGNEGVSFDIALPDATGATIVSTNGRIEIAGLSGEARLTTSNGRIMANNHDGALFATTTNGRIEATDIAGEARLTSSNGRLIADRIAGPLTARTSNGAVQITLLPENPGPFSVSTSNGSVVLKGGKGLRASLDLKTSNGKIVVTRGGETMEFKSPTRVEINGGGPTSVIGTSNGRITVEIDASGD